MNRFVNSAALQFIFVIFACNNYSTDWLFKFLNIMYTLPWILLYMTSRPKNKIKFPPSLHTNKKQALPKIFFTVRTKKIFYCYDNHILILSGAKWLKNVLKMLSKTHFSCMFEKQLPMSYMGEIIKFKYSHELVQGTFVLF